MSEELDTIQCVHCGEDTMSILLEYCLNEECDADIDAPVGDPPTTWPTEEFVDRGKEKALKRQAEMRGETKKPKKDNLISLPVRYEQVFVDSIRYHCQSKDLVMRSFIREAIEEAMKGEAEGILNEELGEMIEEINKEIEPIEMNEEEPVKKSFWKLFKGRA